MVDFKYLYLGLCGLARAHLANAMTGHLGAAVVTGYFIGEELPDLDQRVYAGIEHELDQIMNGEEAFWYDAEQSGITIPELFKPFPDKPAADEQASEVPDLETKLATISTALAVNIDTLREAGHNVIFSSIAMRALKDHPQYATDSIVGGIGKLIARFDSAGTGRGYYGKERGWIQGNEVKLEEENDFPAYRNQQDMVEVVIDELIQSAAIRRQGFGGLFHIINHAAAITELTRLGYGPLAVRGLPVHHYHVRLWRSLPDVETELGPLKAAKHDPRTPEYWQAPESSQWSAQLTHRVKTIFGFHTLLRLVQSEAKRKQAEEKFLYLMA
jgi:hypothetical protein